MRERLESAELQRAVFEFLAAYEPDLVAAAAALDIPPAALVAAGERLAP